MPCPEGPRRPSGRRSRSRSTGRSARSPTAGRPPAPRPRTRRSARPLRGHRAAQRSCLLLLLRRLTTREPAEVVIGRAVTEGPEGLARTAAGDPAADEPDDGVVELLGRHTSKNRPCDGGGTIEAAA